MKTIYVASKCLHAPKWLSFRKRGLFLEFNKRYHVISTWIDEAYPGQTADFADLWKRNIDEAARADMLIAYHEPGEELKGALVEIGAALAAGKQVRLVGFEDRFSFFHHPLCQRFETLEEAFTF